MLKLTFLYQPIKLHELFQLGLVIWGLLTAVTIYNLSCTPDCKINVICRQTNVALLHISVITVVSYFPA